MIENQWSTLDPWMDCTMYWKKGYAYSKKAMPGFHMIVLIVPANDPDD